MSKRRRSRTYVPHQVVTNILARLPARSLLRLRCVSKHWLAMTDDPLFVSAHLEASRAARPGIISVHLGEQKLFCMDTNGATTLEMALPPEMGTLESYGFPQLGSCNGLVLLSTFTRAVVCNPATCYTLALPEFSVKVPLPWWRSCSLWTPGRKDFFCCLGFDPWTRRHKVLHMARKGDSHLWVCEVLTLGADLGADPPHSWRRIGRCPPPIALHASFLDGTLYWMTSLVTNGNRTKHMVSFDLREESLRTAPLPERFALNDVNAMGIAVVDGRLCVWEAQSCCAQKTKVLQLWMLFEKERAWLSKQIDLPFGGFPVAVHRGEILLKGPQQLVYYSVHDGMLKVCREGMDVFYLGSVLDHVESLVWPLQVN